MLLRPRSIAMAVAIIITREPDEQYRAGNEPGQHAAEVGAGHARRAEYQARAPLDAAGARVRDGADRAGDADHQQ